MGWITMEAKVADAPPQTNGSRRLASADDAAVLLPASPMMMMMVFCKRLKKVSAPRLAISVSASGRKVESKLFSVVVGRRRASADTKNWKATASFIG
jgi:hypothetical protein